MLHFEEFGFGLCHTYSWGPKQYHNRKYRDDSLHDKVGIWLPHWGIVHVLQKAAKTVQTTIKKFAMSHRYGNSKPMRQFTISFYLWQIICSS